MSDTFGDEEPYLTDDGLMIELTPKSCLDDNGVRHAIVWGEDEEIKYKLDPETKTMIRDFTIF